MRWYSRNLVRAFSLLVLGIVVCLPTVTRADSAASVLPSSTIAYIEVADPAELIDQIREHKVVNFVQQQDEFKKILASPQFAAAFVGKTVLEQKIGEPLLESLKANLGGGLYFALDAETEGAVVLFNSSDEAKLRRLAGSVLDLVVAQANQAGNKPPFERDRYRDASVAKFDKFVVARYKSWLLASNKPELAKKIVDNLHARSPKSLAEQQWFQSAINLRKSNDVWAAVNLEFIRGSEKATKLFSGKTNNPGIELVFGGVLDALKNTPHAVATLDLDQDLRLVVSMPFDQEWANESREFFFGEQLEGRGPAQLEPKNTIANLSAYRDVAGWWLSKEDLFEENVIAQLAQADSQLSTIFSGMDFGQDVLGALEPGVQIVVAEREFDKSYIPDIRLPAFALVGKLKDPDQIRRRLKVAFQSVIGFANINLGMQGQPQLELESTTTGEARISSAVYMFDDESEKGLLLFNFSPTLAFQGEYLVLSSSRELAIELAGLVQNPVGDCESNTVLRINGRNLGRILDNNREPLIAQNMLEKGHDRRAAETEINTLLAFSRLFKQSVLEFRVEPDLMKLEILIHTEE